jgi:exportin-1
MEKVKRLSIIKKNILKLIGTYVERADSLDMVHMNIVPGFLDAVLVDYNRNAPASREAEVLNVISEMVIKLPVRFTQLSKMLSILPAMNLMVIPKTPYNVFR